MAHHAEINGGESAGGEDAPRRIVRPKSYEERARLAHESGDCYSECPHCKDGPFLHIRPCDRCRCDTATANAEGPVVCEGCEEPDDCVECEEPLTEEDKTRAREGDEWFICSACNDKRCADCERSWGPGVPCRC